MLELLRGECSDRKLQLFAWACARRVSRVLDDDRARQALAAAERLAEGLLDDGERLAAFAQAWELHDGIEADNSQSGWGFRFHNVFRTSDGYVRASLGQTRAAAARAVADLLHPDPHADRSLHYADKAAAEAAGWSAVHAVAHTLPVLSDLSSLQDSMAGDLPREGHAVYSAATATERSWQAGRLRELVGIPFRPSRLTTLWLTRTVLSLAQVAYEERDQASGDLDHASLSVLADAMEEAGCDDEPFLAHLRSPGPHVRGCWALDLVLGKG
jgi:hypothetical protein